ncbi:MAG: hypothetical protein Greene041662_1043 [Candidatus Peregrinibacteria bacterium Greene0416_62]|nr:MAG: hypothetical protein Greene041662_1043 [Candidatus Peregrinibacteria bacterium Greene0416_62]TSD00505.1 MAG: hypothetical protein Greene101449_115 [Candidatus Peregrinibacteria bacterium Greene1014_49]
MSELTGTGSGFGDDTPAPAATPRPPRAPGAPGGRFADEIHSITIHGRQRTFYIDLKQSGNGKFFKVSEKSRGGQKTTIMFDVEDLQKFVEALQEMQGKI